MEFNSKGNYNLKLKSTLQQGSKCLKFDLNLALSVLQNNLEIPNLPK